MLSAIIIKFTFDKFFDRPFILGSCRCRCRFLCDVAVKRDKERIKCEKFIIINIIIIIAAKMRSFLRYLNEMRKIEM